ncbi:MAG: hypothetical protein K0Q49_754 [Haloplasmataceae bacterium]|jgi:predicted bacteriocin transport accessory protein|nr:hypothetical protein [Haloplasmataceae bacterium]
MKNFIYAMTGVLAVLTLIVVIVSAQEPKVVEFKKNEVEQKFDNKDSFLLVIGRSTCSWCTKYKKTTLVDYLDEKREFPLVFVYTDKGNFLGSQDVSDFLIRHGIELNGTPSTYLVIDGEVVNTSSGYMEIDELEAFIEESKNL